MLLFAVRNHRVVRERRVLPYPFAVALAAGARDRPGFRVSGGVESAEGFGAAGGGRSRASSGRSPTQFPFLHRRGRTRSNTLSGRRAIPLGERPHEGQVHIRIATWNMDYWRRSAELRGRAWDYLESQVRPDIALVQEAVPLGRGRAESDTADVVALACCRRETLSSVKSSRMAAEQEAEAAGRCAPAARPPWR